MPRFNQKGPNNEGPMTGRGMGRRTDFGARGMNRSENQSDNDEQFFGRGMGRGRGASGGMGRGIGMGRRGIGNGL